jgi:hypothetical protein
MNADGYLTKILTSQTFHTNAPELEALRRKRDEVQNAIRFAFPGASIRYAGSYAKNTMICASYDLDLTCYFDHDNTQAGDNLEDIYQAVQKALEKDYIVTPKTSTLRLEEGQLERQYTHVDVVPGRFIDDDSGDVFLHQNFGSKLRLKTNLDVHIKAIRDSGLTNTIQLVKYWRELQGLRVKTFVLELLVVKILTPHKLKALSEQLIIFWESLRDGFDSLTIEDPANPEGNDLTPVLAENRIGLQASATTTLLTISDSGWEQVLEDPSNTMSESQKVGAMTSFAQSRVSGAKPWANENEDQRQ